MYPEKIHTQADIKKEREREREREREGERYTDRLWVEAKYSTQLCRIVNMIS